MAWVLERWKAVKLPPGLLGLSGARCSWLRWLAGWLGGGVVQACVLLTVPGARCAPHDEWVALHAGQLHASHAEACSVAGAGVQRV
jgi:hypothetical protein